MADIQAQLNRVRDAANDFAGSAGGKLKDGTSRARESASDLMQTGRDKASEAKEKASAAYSDARDRSQRVAARANEIVQDHPIAATAAAVAAGAVVAWMFPKSRRLMKQLPGVATAIGSRAVEAAIAARAAAAEGADVAKAKASGALATARDGAHAAKSAALDGAAAARDGAVSAKDNVLKSDVAAKASGLADEVIALVAEKASALGDALKTRLPRK
ncbi:MAG: hypothetical protein QHC40_02835 [Sphingobium sp.]|nr:hypothetical protein [Sphingobium sp.]